MSSIQQPRKGEGGGKEKNASQKQQININGEFHPPVPEMGKRGEGGAHKNNEKTRPTDWFNVVVQTCRLTLQPLEGQPSTNSPH